MMQFACPLAFAALLLPLIVWYAVPAAKGLHGDALRVPFLRDLAKINLKSGSIWGGLSADNAKLFSPVRLAVYLVYALVITALARPQWVGEPVRVHNFSRDILLVMDISTSMEEPDFALNGRPVSRLSAVKKVAGEFIDKRGEDRIGLVLFGTRAYLQAPITFDKAAVKQILYAMQAGMAGNSTAIGDALGLALKSLKDSGNLDKKIIILLTDGENNDGSVTLPQAVKLAKEAGVKIYTIGVGGDGSDFASFFGLRMDGGGVDEAGLRQIARDTEGTYFRAKNTASLQKVYAAIDELEPTENEDTFVQEVREFYYIPLLAALALAAFLVLLKRRADNV